MNRKFFQAVALSTCLSTLAAPTFALDLFGWMKSENSLKSMLKQVPEDSMVVFTSTTDEDLAKKMEPWMTKSLSLFPADYQDIFSELEGSPGIEMFGWLMDDYYSTAAEGMDSLNKRYGAKADGSSVFYTDGIYPVIRFALDDEKAIPAVLKEAANASEYELKEISLGDQTLLSFTLFEENDFELNLGVLIHKKIATLAFFSASENDADKLTRFALSETKTELATTRWKEDAKTYDLDENLRGYIDLVAIARTVVDPDSRAHKQLASLIGEEFTYLEEELGASCQEDILGLVNQVPRFVFGTQQMQVNGSDLESTIITSLELTNADVKQNLTNLRGFIPSYIQNDTDLGAGFALGLDVNELAPVAIELWTLFIEKEFKCDLLIEAQEEVMELDPGVIGMGTAMLQGLSSVSMGVYGFQADPESEIGGTIDAVLSLTAQQPQVLTSMATQFVPFFNGLIVPDDGSAVNLRSDELPLDIFVANKGEHLVVYSGTKAEQTAKALLEEKVEANGFAAGRISYPFIGDIMIQAANPMMNLPNSSDDCTEIYFSALMMQSIPLGLSVFSDITENGYEDLYQVTMNLDQALPTESVAAGEYQLEYLDYDCSWMPIGTDVLNEDKTGEYVEMDETNSCRVFENKYTWTQTAGMIEQTITTDRYRDDCASEWIDNDPGDFNCMILKPSQNSFYCMSNDHDEMTLYRYNRK